jgi:hypothetical protein
MFGHRHRPPVGILGPSPCFWRHRRKTEARRQNRRASGAPSDDRSHYLYSFSITLATALGISCTRGVRVGRTGRSRPARRDADLRRRERLLVSSQHELARGLVDALDDAALDVLADRLAPRIVARQAIRAVTGVEDPWMTSRDAAAHLGMSVNALHKLTSARLIPFEQDGPGCKLYFRRSLLDAWRERSGSCT